MGTKKESGDEIDSGCFYFMRQWIPILTSWNLEVEGETTDIVNHTNNALESYNRRFNALFPKTPSLI